jgi:hypothetical protein
MSPFAQNIIDQINAKVRTYAPDAFRGMALNSILQLIVQLADSGSGAGGTIGGSVLRVTNADFVDATRCVLSGFKGASIAIFWNEGGRFIEKDADGGAEWQDLPQGGFQVLLPEFDSTKDTKYRFYVFQM